MLIVADNLQVFRSRFFQALEELDSHPYQDMVERCIKAGANAIDINSGPLPKEPEKKMTFLVNAVQEVTDKTILLDTVNPLALEAGLKACKNPVIINGFSLEKEKLKNILPLARKYDADIIGYLLDTNGHVPTDYELRLSIAIELYTLFQKTGLPHHKLIIDPVLVPVLWENGLEQNRSAISVIQALPEVLGQPLRTIVGLSNLTSGGGSKKEKDYLEMAYVPMLAWAGLSMVMLNIFNTQTVKMVKWSNVILGPGIFAW